MIVLFWVSLGVVALDQLSKWAVLVALTPGSHIPILPVFDITLVFNRGSAFGFLSDAGGWQRPLLIILPLVVSLFLVVIIKRLKPNRRQEGIALALILGGAVGNLFDRIFAVKSSTSSSSTTKAGPFLSSILPISRSISVQPS